MSAKIIKIKQAGGSVTVNVSCPRFPQSIVGIVYRYGANGSKEGAVGSFDTANPDVILGAPSEITNKSFGVLSQVLPFNDDPPTPYEIVVTVSQDGDTLSSEVPADNGSGKVSTEIINSLYYFSIQ